MRWQSVAGIVLLICLIISLFMPRMEISGEKYISMAVDVNQYAKDHHASAAKKTNAKKIIKEYRKGTKKRSAQADKYDKQIEKKSDSISGFYLGKWALTVKNKLEFTGITFKKGKKIKDSNVQGTFKVMGGLLYLPMFFAVFVLILTCIKRKLLPSLLVLTGILTLGCNGVILWIIPGMIWSKISSYVQNFSLIDKDVLAIKGVGKYAIKHMMTEFSAYGLWINVVIGGVFVMAGVMFMTILKEVTVTDDYDDDWNIGADVDAINTELDYMHFKEEVTQSVKHAVTMQEEKEKRQWEEDVFADISGKKSNKGCLRGIQGQYAGAEVEIDAGEEIVLGRDPQYCKLIFDYPKISRRHCGVVFDAETGKYRVIDYSSNGTTFSNGQAAQAGSYITVEPGTIIYLANKHEAIQLG